MRKPSSRGGVEDRPDREVERDETVARGLFRRMSNLARNIIRRLSSNDKRAARQTSKERRGDPNGTDNSQNGGHCWDEMDPWMIGGGESVWWFLRASIEPTQELYRVHKRRSLIFGPRYPN